jgi:hydrogenase maturation protein HypF
MVEPWRNTWAHLATHIGWDRCIERWGDTELMSWFQEQPVAILAQMVARGVNSPLSSSSGRLFDAVAAAVGIHRASITYEGQAAIELEAAAERAPGGAGTYPFSIEHEGNLVRLDPAPMWAALLDDLSAGTKTPVVAARFHRGLAEALCNLAFDLAHHHRVDTVALSGGVFQNRTLFEAVCNGLRQRDLAVLSHRAVPPNDGGLALGQAAAAAARWLAASRT